MKQHYVMPIGVDDFKRVREQYYYVDKTNFIKTLIDGHSQVTLITRPRRFGKTLAMSMLYYFFTMENAQENRALFEGCEVEAAGEKYMSHQGSRPVIFLTLKDLKEPDFASMTEHLGLLMQDVYSSYSFLLEGSLLKSHEKKYFQSILDLSGSTIDLQASLKKLTNYLARYCKLPVIILMDEYDAPIQSSWDNGYYDRAIIFMRNFLSSVLKSNPDLDFAVITGVLRIVKESIFSSLNNLDVASVATGEYLDAMGFTEHEVAKIAADFQVPEKLPEIKAWYDGYNFAGQEIYNPWSVISYFKKDFRPALYWVNTSGNTILHKLLKHASASQIQALYSLMRKESITVSLDEGVIYNEIFTNTNALNSMLLTTGYLTMSDYPEPSLGDFLCTMRIPNQEILFLFKREIMNHIDSIGTDNALTNNLLSSLLTGKAEEFATALNEYLMLMASFYDTAKRESFYHGLMLGLLATLIPRYEVVSNRESGYGRFDLAVFPARNQSTGIIMEFKIAEKESDLPAKAQEALMQIQEKEYPAELERKGITNIWKYGIAFFGKKCQVAT